MSTPRAILIAGPTASGKSALAVAVAARLGGVVVNADSMQVYGDLAILTARPTPAETSAAPHALYGFVPGSEPYSVGRWLVDVTRLLDELRQTGKVAVVVGGTGLYFKALLEGLAPIPPIPVDIRRRWREEAARVGALALHTTLAARDPGTAARLRPTDPQRVTRALEVLDATGRGLADWQREPAHPILSPADTIRLLLAPERQTLYRRAEQRLDAMMAAGALAEVERLAALNYSPELPIMRALGVRPLLAALGGSMPLADAVAAANLETRHYINRQQTWHKRNMISWEKIISQEMERNIRYAFTLIDV